MLNAHDATARYPTSCPLIDYYALEAVHALCGDRPGCDPELGLQAFLAIVDRVDLCPTTDGAGTRPNPAYLCCPGFGTRQLAQALERPYATVRRYTRALEEAGVIAPLGADEQGGATGWRLDLATVRHQAGILALAEDFGGGG